MGLRETGFATAVPANRATVRSYTCDQSMLMRFVISVQLTLCASIADRSSRVRDQCPSMPRQGGGGGSRKRCKILSPVSSREVSLPIIAGRFYEWCTIEYAPRLFAAQLFSARRKPDWQHSVMLLFVARYMLWTAGGNVLSRLVARVQRKEPFDRSSMSLCVAPARSRGW